MQEIERNTRLQAVSKIAFRAHSLDAEGTFMVKFSSVYISIPWFISAFLMKKVFKKLAVPPARLAIIEFIKMSFAPVTREDIPENTFLSRRATETEDPTAAQ